MQMGGLKQWRPKGKAPLVSEANESKAEESEVKVPESNNHDSQLDNNLAGSEQKSSSKFLDQTTLGDEKFNVEPVVSAKSTIT